MPGLARSPAHTVRTQSNHFFASIYAFCKLERLKMKHQINHFALRAKQSRPRKVGQPLK